VPARKKAGLDDLRFHDLRHTAASKIVMGSGTLYDAAEVSAFSKVRDSGG